MAYTYVRTYVRAYIQPYVHISIADVKILISYLFLSGFLYAKLVYLRQKIEAVIRRGGGVADPDAPEDPSSTRFWVTTGTRFTDRERVGVSMEASAAITTTGDTMGQLLGGSTHNGGGTLALTNGPESSAPASTPGVSLESLVNVMSANGGGGGGGSAVAKAKAKSKAKAKAKAGVSLQAAKTPAEKKETIRFFGIVLATFLKWFPIGTNLLLQWA